MTAIVTGAEARKLWATRGSLGSESESQIAGPFLVSLGL